MSATRRLRPLVLLLPLLLLGGCVTQPEEPAPGYFPPPSYAYLPKLRLNVANIDVDDSWLPGPGDLGPLSPVPPVQALERMARDRLVAAGGSGHAVFHIDDASLRREGGELSAHFAVRLDIYTATGAPGGFAEAGVARIAPAPEGRGPALQAALYDLTRQMMDGMNVEFEYQVRHNLENWLAEASPPGAAVPAPVEAQPLPPPGAAPPLLPPPPEPTPLAPPPNLTVP